MLAGKQASWNVGLEYSTPLGRRFAHAQARNLELSIVACEMDPARQAAQIEDFVTQKVAALVETVNPQRSVAVCLEGVNVGNVTIPANFDVPKVGDIVEVRYLYYNPGGALYQATYLGVRDDLDADACRLSQLKCKSALEE